MSSDLGFGDSTPEAGSTSVDLGLFQQEMQELLVKGASETDGAIAAIRSLLALPDAYAAAYFRSLETRRLRPASPLICHHQYAQLIRGHESRLVDAVDRMVRVEGPIAYPLGDAEFTIFVYPLGAPGNVSGAIALFAAVDAKEAEKSPLILAAGLVAAELSHIHLNSSEIAAATSQPTEPVASLPQSNERNEPTDSSARTATGFPTSNLQDALGSKLVGELVNSRQDETVQTICHRIANRIEEHLTVSQVMLGLADRKQKRCKLQAMSGMPGFASHSPLVTQAEELMAESILHDDLFESALTDRPHELTSAEVSLLQCCDAKKLVHGPLTDQTGRKVGAWIAIEHPDQRAVAGQKSMIARMADAQPVVGGVLSLLYRMRRDRLGRFARKLMLPDDDVDGRRRFWQAAAAVTVLMLCPLPYRVNCDAELFPVQHRLVPAPYEGVLKEVLVEPGDIVRKDQVLARMDAKELNLKLVASRAELKRASKQHDMNLAKRDTSAAQLAQLEMERIDAETQMLEDRVNKLEIKSPVDGIILGGESKKLEGARIKVGEHLFETGPLKLMVAEVYVSDAEIARVEPGQPVKVRLDAFPFRSFSGTIAKLGPRAEAHHDENVFVADVELNNFKNLLRPGMVGRARVSTGWRPLAWNLFHKPFDQLLRIVRW